MTDTCGNLAIARILIIIICFIGFPQPQYLFTSEFDAKSFGATGDGITDDSLAVSRTWDAACGSATGQFKLPMGNFLVGPMAFSGPCKAKVMVVNAMGNITAQPKNKWTNKTADTWIKSDHIDNLVMTGNGKFDGQGVSGWWNVCDKTKTCEDNPTALKFHACNGLQLVGVTSINSPKNHISINTCNGVIISNITIIAPKESPNTDGIDISDSNGVQVNGGNIGTGNDCIAINGGCSNINVTRLTCGPGHGIRFLFPAFNHKTFTYVLWFREINLITTCGPGHGISVGSRGRNGDTDVVRNVNVVGTTFIGTQNGVRIKTVPGGSGSASHIKFSNIRMTGVEHPIILTQFYCPHDPTKCGDRVPVVKISDVSFFDIKGTSSKHEAININCSAISPGSCVGITLQQINIQPTNSSFKVGSTCVNTHAQVIEPVFPPVVCIPGSLIDMPLDYYDYTKSEQAIATI